MKVFQIGFNKCGTNSICDRLTALGIRSCHLLTDDGRYIAKVMRDNLESGRHVLDTIEEYDGFTDLEYLTETEFVEANRFFLEFRDQVPGAHFILNIRDKQKWIGSRLDHEEGRYARLIMAINGLSSVDDLKAKWSADWDTHLAAVQEAIPADQLLVFNIETDPFTAIDEFLGLPSPADAPRIPANFTRSSLSKWLSRNSPRALTRLLPSNLKTRVHYQLRRRR